MWLDWEEDTLTLTATFPEVAGLWAHDRRVYLDVWHPDSKLHLYASRWVTLPGDVLLAGHLDFHDAAGHTWIEYVDATRPVWPFDQDGAVLAQWEHGLERHLFTWQSSLTHQRFTWVHANNPALLR